MHLEVDHLFDLELFGVPHDVGGLAQGRRRVVQVTGGSFKGDRLGGEVLPVGADIALIRTDGVFVPDVDLLLKTDDGALIHVDYRGRFHGPAEVMRKLVAREPGVQPGDFYLWNAMFFETSAEPYLWLNGVTAVSTGMPGPVTPLGIGIHYDVFALK